MDNSDGFSKARFSVLMQGALKGISLSIFVLVARQRLTPSAILVGTTVGVLIGVGTQYLWYYLHQRRLHFSLKDTFGDTYMMAFRFEADRTSLASMIGRRWFSKFSDKHDSNAAR